MDLARFGALLEAYGADPRRWPEVERAGAEAFAAEHASVIAPLVREAEALDTVLTQSLAADASSHDLLAARILRLRPASLALGRRALFALAACAVFGVLIGYSGGLMAPPSDFGFDIAEAFVAPYPGEGG